MQLKRKEQDHCVKVILEHNGDEIARGYLYLIHNDLHKMPYGLIEDVFVNGGHRGKGHGKKIVAQLIAEAKEKNCYKLIGTSRLSRGEAHSFYNGLGFEEYGKEFRMNL